MGSKVAAGPGEGWGLNLAAIQARKNIIKAGLAQPHLDSAQGNPPFSFMLPEHLDHLVVLALMNCLLPPARTVAPFKLPLFLKDAEEDNF